MDRPRCSSIGSPRAADGDTWVLSAGLAGMPRFGMAVGMRIPVSSELGSLPEPWLGQRPLRHIAHITIPIILLRAAIILIRLVTRRKRMRCRAAAPHSRRPLLNMLRQ